MKFRKLIIFSAIVTGNVILFSCTGDGVGLDEFGDPIDTTSLNIDTTNNDSAPSNSIEPTLDSIQENVFSAICAVKCHKLPRPKKNLILEEGQAYDNLVNVPSEERPQLMRVSPGDIDGSYITWKIEGRDGIYGKRMPLNLPPLSTEKIQAIRTWIENGALP